MNLIEQLGGYDRAKHEFEMIKEMEPIYPGEIATNNRLLLEYRRQHNIFEVGDKVVLVGQGTWGHLFEIQEMSPKGKKPTKLKTKNFGNFHVGYTGVCHATDEEIKAGKRLEVKSEN